MKTTHQECLYKIAVYNKLGRGLNRSNYRKELNGLRLRSVLDTDSVLRSLEVGIN